MSKGGDQTSTVTNEVNVPAFLQPFMDQAAGTSQAGLTGFQDAVNSGLHAGLTPTQINAINTGINRAGDPNSAFGTALNTASNIAQGGQLPGSDTLEGFASGAMGGVSPEVLQMLSGGNPQFAQAFESLRQLQGADPFNQAGMDALTSTAQGDFLFGGNGFDQAVDAAVRAATPSIGSAFGGTAGGLSGGLARQAVGDTAVNAFASQFGQERNRQQQASSILNQLGLQRRGQDIGIGNSLAGFGLAGGNQNLQAANILGGLQSGAQNRQLGAANSLGGFGLGQQGNALRAAQMLPGLANADINSILGFGGMIQGDQQNAINRNLAGQQGLINAGTSGVGGFSPLFGSTGTETISQPDDPFSTLLGGALTAGSLFAGPSALFPGAMSGIAGLFGGGDTATANRLFNTGFSNPAIGRFNSGS